jgi:putative transposase
MSTAMVSGKGKRRRLSPSEKYEIYVSVLTGQSTQREAADRYGVDRSTVVTACRVARQGALDALAAAVPGRPGVSREQAALEDARAEIDRLRATVTEQAVALHLHEGKARWDDHAVRHGWAARRACRLLRIDPDRVASWRRRASAGELVDRPCGGGPVHGLLKRERAAIIDLFEGWADVDKGHRKLAARGSRLGLAHVSASTLRRVLAVEGLVLQRHPVREPQVKAPWPEWIEWKPQRVWCYDFSHFTKAKRVAVAIMDVVSRRWLTTLVTAEETSSQVETAFMAALQEEQLADRIDFRLLAALRAGHVSTVDLDGPQADGLPVLIAMSDNGPQMRSHSTREFMAACAIMQRFGRPGTPTDQAWIESLFGHVKTEWPHLEKIRDPGQLELELDRTRDEYNTVRLHAGIGYVTPDEEHHGRGDAIRQSRIDALAAARQARIDYRRTTRNPR